MGWKYHGFARQPNTEETIEAHLFRALRQQKLIDAEADISTLNYSRCGRTDAGVSALGQVGSTSCSCSCGCSCIRGPPRLPWACPHLHHRAPLRSTCT